MSPKRKSASHKAGALEAKIRRALRAHALGKKNYELADALIQEIANEMEPGQIVDLSNGKGVQLVDCFAGESIVWNPCAARRWKLKEVPITEEKV